MNVLYVRINHSNWIAVYFYYSGSCSTVTDLLHPIHLSYIKRIHILRIIHESFHFERQTRNKIFLREIERSAISSYRIAAVHNPNLNSDPTLNKLLWRILVPILEHSQSKTFNLYIKSWKWYRVEDILWN